MLIVWGRKRVFSNEGFVADFCEICRELKGFKLRRVGSIFHLYGIGIGQNRLVGYQRCCETCKTSFHANIDRYKELVKKAESFEELQERSYPSLHQEFADRLKLEEKVKATSTLLTSQERHALIRAPFMLLVPKVDRLYYRLHFGKGFLIALTVTIGILILGPTLIQDISEEHSKFVFVAFLIPACMSIIWQIWMSGQNFLRSQIIPVLVSALNNLKPSESELQSVLLELKMANHKLGAKLKLKDLLTSLNQTAGLPEQ
jgi:hypothetical protein